MVIVVLEVNNYCSGGGKYITCCAEVVGVEVVVVLTKQRQLTGNCILYDNTVFWDKISNAFALSPSANLDYVLVSLILQHPHLFLFALTSESCLVWLCATCT